MSDYVGTGNIASTFFYPLDFTFVCPTEIRFNDRLDEFKALNTSRDRGVDGWEAAGHRAMTERERGGLGPMRIPIVADRTKEISAKYGVLLEDRGIALRGLFIIDGESRRVPRQQITMNNLPVAADETLRLN